MKRVLHLILLISLFLAAGSLAAQDDSESAPLLTMLAAVPDSPTLRTEMNFIVSRNPPSVITFKTNVSGTPNSTAKRRSGRWLENGMALCWRSLAIS